MTQQCYASGINPSAIPGDELDPDAVEAAARALAADGAAVRDSGADVLNDWRGLALHYEAPEAPRLLSVMDPVETNARRFGDDVESVAAALTAYAEEVRPIKASLAAVRADAWAFRSDIASEPEWEYDQDLVDRNTALVSRVNALQVRLWEAERRCANAIRGLYGAPAWRAATSEGDARGYGIDEIPTDAVMPWGSEVQRKDHCPKSAAVGVKRFVWDGVVVDGFWGTITGLGMLVGIDGSGWSWETMKTSWVGMGSLIGYSGGEWSWGNAGDAWTALGKGLIAYDTWDEDPARAAGGAVFNIATILIPAGAAVTGTKTAGTAAGTAGRTATLLARGARVVDFVDPVALGLMGGRAALPKIGDMLTDMRLATQGLGDVVRVPDAVPTVRVDLDVAGVGLDDAVRASDDLDGLAGDLPPVRDPDAAEPVAAPVPQREPALVGGAAPEVPGGLGQGADSLHQPPGTPTTTGGAPQTGGAVGADPAPTPGDPPSTAPTGAGGRGTEPADGPGTEPGDGPGTEPAAGPPRSTVEIGGQDHVVRTAEELVFDQPHFADSLDRELRDRGLSRGEFDALVSRPLQELSRDQVHVLLDVREALPPIQPDDVIQKVVPPEVARNLLGRDVFDVLVEPQVLARLDEAQSWVTADGRPAVDTTRGMTDIGGFVARLADVTGLSSTRLFHDLGLGYEFSTFVDDGSVFAVRDRAGDLSTAVLDPANAHRPVIEANQPLTVMRQAMYEPALDGSGRTRFDEIHAMTDAAAQRQEWLQFAEERGAGYSMDQGLDPENPHRGNGFGGVGQLYAPEFTYGLNKDPLRPGAEMWQIRPDGTRDLVAVFSGKSWDLVDGVRP